MAMQDYFYDCNKIESKTISDGLGGYETVEYVGISFKGLAVKGSLTEQVVGAIRGVESGSYNFHAPSNVPLKKDDKISYNEKGLTRYLRLTSSAIVNTEQSTQTDWVTYTAETYIPTRVINGE